MVRDETESEGEESSSSSDEMIFDPRQKSTLLANRDRSSAADERPIYASRISDISMPGSIILENSDTPPPFRKRTLQMTQEDKYYHSTNANVQPSSKQELNGTIDCKCAF